MTKPNTKAIVKAKFAFFWALTADAKLSAPAKCVAGVLIFKFHNNKNGLCTIPHS